MILSTCLHRHRHIGVLDTLNTLTALLVYTSVGAWARGTAIISLDASSPSHGPNEADLYTLRRHLGTGPAWNDMNQEAPKVSTSELEVDHVLVRRAGDEEPPRKQEIPSLVHVPSGLGLYPLQTHLYPPGPILSGVGGQGPTPQPFFLSPHPSHQLPFGASPPRYSSFPSIPSGRSFGGPLPFFAHPQHSIPRGVPLGHLAEGSPEPKTKPSRRIRQPMVQINTGEVRYDRQLTSVLPLPCTKIEDESGHVYRMSQLRSAIALVVQGLKVRASQWCAALISRASIKSTLKQVQVRDWQATIAWIFVPRTGGPESDISAKMQNNLNVIETYLRGEGVEHFRLHPYTPPRKGVNEWVTITAYPSLAIWMNRQPVGSPPPYPW